MAPTLPSNGTGIRPFMLPYTWTNIPSVVPFTYRDSTTMLKLMDGFRRYITETFHVDLVRWLNAEIDQIQANIDALAGDLTAQQNVFESAITYLVEQINNRVGPAEVQHVKVNGDMTLTIDPAWPTNHVLWYEFTQQGEGGGTVKWAGRVDGVADLSADPGTVTRTMLFPNGNGTWTVVNAGEFAKVFVYYGSAFARAMSAHNGVYNVMDYGAIGDGDADDGAAVQAATDAACKAGGGTVYFPPGLYYWDLPVVVCSNIAYEGDGATLKKDWRRTWMTLFTIQSKGRVGYGSGAKNVTFRNFTVKGNFDTHTAVTFLAANHGSNIVVENVEFIEALEKGHIFDLQGCDGVRFVDCIFRGQQLDTSYAYSEAIQLDNSTKSGSSYTDSDGSFDGLSTRNVVLERCQFLPLVKGNMTYQAPIAIGSHYGVRTFYQEDIVIRDNIFMSPYEDTASFVRGQIHFMSARRVSIYGNKFYGSGRAHRAINVIAQNSGPSAGDANDPSAPATVWSQKQTCDHFKIYNNEFIGFKSTKNGDPIIGVFGGFGQNAKDWEVRNNGFHDVTGGSKSENLGPNPIEAVMVDDLKVTGNRVDTARRVLSATDVTDLKITGNTSAGTSVAVAYYLTRCYRVSLAGNSLSDYRGGFMLNNCGQFGVIDNTFRDEGAESFTSINLSAGSWHGRVLGNDILSTVSGSIGLLAQDGITRVIARDNIIRGMGTPFSQIGDSAVTWDSNMTT